MLERYLILRTRDPKQVIPLMASSGRLSCPSACEVTLDHHEDGRAVYAVHLDKDRDLPREYEKNAIPRVTMISLSPVRSKPRLLIQKLDLNNKVNAEEFSHEISRYMSYSSPKNATLREVTKKTWEKIKYSRSLRASCKMAAYHTLKNMF